MKARLDINPFDPKSDQNVISAQSDTADQFAKIVRIKEMITNPAGETQYGRRFTGFLWRKRSIVLKRTLEFEPALEIKVE